MATPVIVTYDATWTYSQPVSNIVTTSVVGTTYLDNVGPGHVTNLLFSTDGPSGGSPFSTSLALSFSYGTPTFNFAKAVPTTYTVPATSPTISTSPPSVSTAATTRSTTDADSTSTRTTATTSPTHHSKSKGFSKGATGGIAVACAVGGALLAGIIVCFLMRRRRRYSRPAPRSAMPRSMRPSSSNGDSAMMGKAGDSTAMSELESRPLLAFNAILPSPLEDSQLQKEMSRLDTFIANHARSYYSNNSDRIPPSIDDPVYEQLQRLLGPHCHASGQLIAALLSSPKARIGAVRLLLAWTILSNIESGSPPEQTLLPPEISECLQSVNNSVRNPGDRFLILSKWRHITGVLLRATYGSAAIEANDPRQTNIQELVAALNRILAPFATARNDYEREANLEEIVKLGARFGYTILTQPTSWSFDWTEPQPKQRSELVIFPDLVQTGDDQGQVRNRPIRYGNKQTTNIGSVAI